MDISLYFDIFIYENWLIVPNIYHSCQVGNRRWGGGGGGGGGGGVVVLVGRGEETGFVLEKQLKINNWWSCNKWGWWE